MLFFNIIIDMMIMNAMQKAITQENKNIKNRTFVCHLLMLGVFHDVYVHINLYLMVINKHL